MESNLFLHLLLLTVEVEAAREIVESDPGVKTATTAGLKEFRTMASRVLTAERKLSMLSGGMVRSKDHSSIPDKPLIKYGTLSASAKGGSGLLENIQLDYIFQYVFRGSFVRFLNRIFNHNGPFRVDN